MPKGSRKKAAVDAPAKATPPPWLAQKLERAPQDPDELHDWLASVLGVRLARTPMLAGHAAPFEYLCHVFFEGKFPRASAPDAPGADSPDVVVWANRGGGKTYLGALATLLDLLFKPGIQIRILGGSLEQSLRMRGYLAALLNHENLDSIARRITARSVTILHSAGQVSVAEVLAASQTSVRGTRVQKLRCDEVDLFDPEVWAAAQLVTRSMDSEGPWGPRVRGGIEALSTMHEPFGLMWSLVGPPSAKPAAGAPPSEGAKVRPMRPTFRWGVLDVLEHCGPEHVCERCILQPECEGRAKAVMIPARHGHVSVSDAAGMKARVSQDTWEAEMLCLRPSRSNSVYPAFDAATHVVGDPAPGAFERYIGGMDFGYRSECVLLLAGVDHDGCVTVLREHARKGAVVDDFADALDRWVAQGVCTHDQIEFLGVDPAGAGHTMTNHQSCVDMLKARGLRVRMRSMEIAPGVRMVADRISPTRGPAAHLNRPRLLVHHSCTRLIECLTRYHYNPAKPESMDPMKDGFDHAPDALRYMITNLDAGVRVEVASYL